jgi:hypothetical protein
MFPLCANVTSASNRDAVPTDMEDSVFIVAPIGRMVYLNPL